MKAQIAPMTHHQLAGLFSVKPNEKQQAQLEVYNLEALFYCKNDASVVPQINALVKKFNVKTSVR